MENDPNSQNKSTITYARQRMVPRYTFVATTEITDSSTLKKTAGNVEEISRNGCYVETMNVFPVGTPLDVRIARDQETFTTQGESIYVHERRGMGIVFIDTPKDQLKILDSWLAERSSIVAIL